MSEIDIDQLFRDAEGGMKIPGKEKHWQSTASFIKTKKSKKRRFLVYFILFIGVSLFAGTAFNSLNESESVISNNEIENLNSPKKLATNFQENRKPENPRSSKKINNSTLESPNNLINNEPIGNDALENNNVSRKVLSKEKKPIDETESIERDNLEKVKKVELPLTKEKDNSKTEKESYPLFINNLIGVVDSNNKKTISTLPEIASLLLVAVPKKEDEMIYNTEKAEMVEVEDVVGADEKNEIELTENADEQNNPSEPLKSTKVKDDKWIYFVGVKGGISLGMPHSVFSRSADVNNSFTSSDKKNATFNSAFDFSVQKNGWIISTGLEWQTYANTFSYLSNQYTESEKYKVNDKSYWRVENTTYIFRDSVFYYDLGKPIYRVDTVKVLVSDSSYMLVLDSQLVDYTDTSQYEVGNTAKASYLEIPLLLGYEFGKNKLRFSLNAGVGIGFLTGVGYKNLEYGNAFGEFAKQEYNFNKTIINFILRTRLSYRVNSIGVYGDVNFKSTRTEMLEDNAQIKWTHNNLNLGLGVFYQF